MRSQGACFERDWGVIVLCTMFLVSCIFFNKCLFFMLHGWIPSGQTSYFIADNILRVSYVSSHLPFTINLGTRFHHHSLLQMKAWAFKWLAKTTQPASVTAVVSKPGFKPACLALQAASNQHISCLLKAICFENWHLIFIPIGH